MLEVLNSDYVRTARAKGVPRRQVIFKHALRNALIPFTTVTALDTAGLDRGCDHHRADLLDLRYGPGLHHCVGRRRRAVPAGVVLLRRGRRDRRSTCWPTSVRRARPADPAVVSARHASAPMDDAQLATTEPEARTNWQLFRRRFMRHRLGLISIAILVILMIACYGAPWLAPYKQNVQHLLAERPGSEPRSTRSAPTISVAISSARSCTRGAISLDDRTGRSRCSRPSSGVTIGAVAAYFSGRTDRRVLSALTDLVPDPARPRTARGCRATLRPR